MNSIHLTTVEEMFYSSRDVHRVLDVQKYPNDGLFLMKHLLYPEYQGVSTNLSFVCNKKNERKILRNALTKSFNRYTAHFRNKHQFGTSSVN